MRYVKHKAFDAEFQGEYASFSPGQEPGCRSWIADPLGQEVVVHGIQ
jgi:hypothetical protein